MPTTSPSRKTAVPPTFTKTQRLGYSSIMSVATSPQAPRTQKLSLSTVKTVADIRPAAPVLSRGPGGASVGTLRPTGSSRYLKRALSNANFNAGSPPAKVRAVGPERAAQAARSPTNLPVAVRALSAEQAAQASSLPSNLSAAAIEYIQDMHRSLIRQRALGFEALSPEHRFYPVTFVRLSPPPLAEEVGGLLAWKGPSTHFLATLKDKRWQVNAKGYSAWEVFNEVKKAVQALAQPENLGMADIQSAISQRLQIKVAAKSGSTRVSLEVLPPCSYSLPFKGSRGSLQARSHN